MKVLMFGWEFPPHISGGLGTACYGLTRSLVRAGVDVLFVVPRLYGDERAKGTVLINASAVRRNGRDRLGAKQTAASERRFTAAVRLPGEPAFIAPEVKSRGAMTYMGIPASLSPYDRTSDKPSPEKNKTLALWNYTMGRAGSTPSASWTDGSVSPTDALVDTEETDRDTDDDGFLFTGTYGPNLFEEVRRYGEIGGVLAANHSFDVVHAHDWMTFEAGIRAKQVSGKPLVIHVHSTELDRAGEQVNQKVFELERKGFQEADRIITVSNWTRQIVKSRYRIPAEKIAVVHNGILPKKKAAGFYFPEIGSHFVTFLGRVTHQKGPAFFVEAAYNVLKEFPEAHFIVAGAGDLLPQMIERVAQLGMSANFHFTGFLSGDEVDQVWSMTDVYVMPSVSEPFGIAPLEAIQGGVPVILSNQSGVSEVMPHAIKVDFWDVKALARAICSVIRYESLSDVLRQQSKQHLKRLTWHKAASDVKALYHEVTGKK